MIFVRATIGFLNAMGTAGAYAGGSNSSDAQAFKNYINSKQDFGTCERDDFKYCYYCATQNVKSAEDDLLDMGFECNINETSNCDESSGFVYVVTKGKRHK